MLGLERGDLSWAVRRGSGRPGRPGKATSGGALMARADEVRVRATGAVPVRARVRTLPRGGERVGRSGGARRGPQRRVWGQDGRDGGTGVLPGERGPGRLTGSHGRPRVASCSLPLYFGDALCGGPRAPGGCRATPTGVEPGRRAGRRPDEPESARRPQCRPGRHADIRGLAARSRCGGDYLTATQCG
jgi:hypothetical protein